MWPNWQKAEDEQGNLSFYCQIELEIFIFNFMYCMEDSHFSKKGSSEQEDSSGALFLDSKRGGGGGIICLDCRPLCFLVVHQRLPLNVPWSWATHSNILLFLVIGIVLYCITSGSLLYCIVHPWLCVEIMISLTGVWGSLVQGSLSYFGGSFGLEWQICLRTDAISHQAGDSCTHRLLVVNTVRTVLYTVH